MSARTEYPAIFAARGDPQLRHIAGFLWNPNDPQSNLPSTAALWAEAGTERGVITRFLVRPGVPYEAAEGFAYVSLTSTTEGIGSIETATAPGELKVAGPGEALDSTDVLIKRWTNQTVAINEVAEFVLVRPQRAKTLELLGRRLFTTNPGGGTWTFILYVTDPVSKLKLTGPANLGVLHGAGLMEWGAGGTGPTLSMGAPSGYHGQDFLLVWGDVAAATPTAYPYRLAGRPPAVTTVRVEHGNLNADTFSAAMAFDLVARWGF
jgi:hypothetical protein